MTAERSRGRRFGRRLRGAVGTGLAVAFIAVTANAFTLNRPLLDELYAPLLLIAGAAVSPALAVFVLAARARRVPWSWLGLAGAWSLFAVPWLATAGSIILAGDRYGPGLLPIDPPASDADWFHPTSAIVAPIVEEPAKALGALVALLGIRRAGVRVTLAVGAAVGALAGLVFCVAEIAHHITAAALEIGFQDLSGQFVVDWLFIQQLATVQIVERIVVLGASNHALFTAAAGIAIASWMAGRRTAAAGWFAGALLAHGLLNTMGAGLGGEVFSAVGRALAGSGLAGTVVTAWLAGATSFVVAEGWLAVLVVRRLRRSRNEAGTSAAPAPRISEPIPVDA